MILIGSDIQQIWKFLGSYWMSFENKDQIEIIWQAVKDFADKLYDKATFIGNSNSISAINTVFIDDPSYIVLTESTTISGNTVYKLPKPVYAIESITDTITNKVYTADNDDYTIYDYQYLGWNVDVPATSYKFKVTGVQLLNVVIYELWTKLLGLTFKKYESSYTNYALTRVEYLPYFLWALLYYKLQPPTIKNITNAIAISRGLPFALESGVLSYGDFEITGSVTIGNIAYNLQGLQPLADGTVVEKFQPIVNSTEFSITVDLNNVTCGLSAEAESVIHDEAFFEKYITGILPGSVTYTEDSL